MTDRPLPEEPPPDVDDWTGEPKAPDMAGPGAEYTNEPGDGVPGVRSGEEESGEERSGEERQPA